MPRYVALLRAVNVGGRNKLPMAELRTVVETLGHTEVVTYIQSGNVVFTAARSTTPAAVEKAIAERFGLPIDVILRTSRQMRAIVDANPFPEADPSKVHVGFLAKKPASAVIKGLDLKPFLPDEVRFEACEMYLHLPNGMGRTKLAPYLDRKLKVPWTARSWSSVLKLLELSGG
jgi:uncharacterized protein (DUF1697 family)